MEDLKKKVEALLFSSGRKMSLEELSKLCRQSPEDIKTTLDELKKEYTEKKSSLMVIDEGDFWKLTTKEDYLHLVKNIVTKTELTKTLMETLAVTAFRYPIKQSDLIKIRTNKAYDHLKELEEMGYITRQKYGRTKLIKLTQKFFDYFSLPQEKLKEQFKDFEGLAQAIESKEGEIKKIMEEQKKKAKEVDLIDGKGSEVKLEVVDEQEEEKKEEEKAKVAVYGDKLGDLEVVDEPEIKPKEEIKEEEKKEEPEGIEVTDEMEERVDERVDEILGLRGAGGEEETEKEPIEDATQELPTEETRTEAKVEEADEEEPSEVDKKIDELLHPKQEEAQKLSEIDESKWGQEELKSEEEPKDLLESTFEEKNKKKNSKNNS